MRIASLLPAATEMACALGLEAQLVGISFECDYPPSVTRLPRLVHTALHTENLTPAEIDEAVTARLQSGQSLYAIDETKLAEARPDLILTQNLCQVCAPSGNELSQSLGALAHRPEVLFMSPHTLADVQENLRALSRATGTEAKAQALLQDWHTRTAAVQARVARLHRPTVCVLEWADPLFCAGHWLAEMIALAGGNDPLSRIGQDSVRISFQQLQETNPNIIILAPCGYNEAQAKEQLKLLENLPGWKSLKA
ncbi:MAG: ABC transporter substrate-binding protein, partial [Rickettsiales bacterium]|nr:ABC transporter substrate-binding protein [Rickettsiales bacterium]